MDQRTGTLLVPQGLAVEWHIKDYFELKEKELHSPNFPFLDATWYLSIHPNGARPEDTVGWTCLYLMKDSPSSKKHHIGFKMGIKKADGSVFCSFAESYLFQECHVGFGPDDPVRPSDLLESRSVLAPDNILQIFCILRPANDVPVESASQTPLSKSIHLETLSENLTQLCMNGSHSDVTIVVKDQEFHAHKSMLSARSTVFSSMFAQETAESQNGQLDITDCNPETFKNFLLYVYTGRVNGDACEDACDLYKFADKYKLQELKADCIERMTRKIAVDSFCDVFLTAVMHDDSELLETATKFFIKNMKAIFLTPKWQFFLKNYPTTSNELLIKMASAS